jgi:hypothetical protein
VTGKPEVIPLFCRHSDCRPAFGLDTSDQIIPAVPHRVLEITAVWNPVRPAFGQHFDSALIDPVEDAKLVRETRIVGGVLAAKSEIFDEGREIIPTLGSLTYGSSRHLVSHRIV